MKELTPALQDLLTRLVKSVPEARVPEEHALAAERALHGVRLRLLPLVGAAGFQALLSRSLALARREAEGLDGLEVTPDGSLGGFAAAVEARGADEMAGAATVLLAQLLDLLATFIGEDLTLRLIGNAAASESRGGTTSGAEEMSE